MLRELHPIDDTPICVAFPWLGVFTKCGVPNIPEYRDKQDGENHTLGNESTVSLLEGQKKEKKETYMVNGKEFKKKSKKSKKNNLGKKAFEEEPLAPLGFGIVAYDHILWTLIVVFALFSLMLLPTLNFFQNGTGYATVSPKITQYEKSSLGNLGYSSVQCAAIPVEVGRLNMQCPFGTIGQVLDYGVNKNTDLA